MTKGRDTTYEERIAFVKECMEYEKKQDVHIRKKNMEL